MRICWQFGDGRDTCIQYSNTNPGPYLINHIYNQPGVYEVCVKILYQEGCEARKCRPVEMIRPDTCGANFERLAVSPATNPLLVYFKALPSHNNNNKPQKICWQFGDGRDTCINNTAAFTGPYGISHTYLHPGLYEVCVNILYYGGCEARKCHPIQAGRPDSCGANFERLPITPNNNPLFAYFKALPSHNNNRKPPKYAGHLVIRLLLPRRRPSGVFAVSDGFITLSTLNNGMFSRLCEVLEAGHLAVDERFSSNKLRLTHAEGLNEEVACILKCQPLSFWLPKLQAADVLACAGQHL